MTDQERIDELERELSAAKGALAAVRAERDAFAAALETCGIHLVLHRSDDGCLSWNITTHGDMGRVAVHNEELERQLAAERKRREKAEATCLELRRVLRNVRSALEALQAHSRNDSCLFCDMPWGVPVDFHDEACLHRAIEEALYASVDAG